MSISGNEGFYAVAIQSGKGSANLQVADMEFVEAMTAPFQIAEQARTRRPTIGDQPFPRGAYKISTGLTNSLGFEVSSQPIGMLMYLLTGGKSVGDVFRVSIDSTPTAGDFTLDYDDDTGAPAPETTAAIAYDATAAAVKSAIAALTNCSNDDVLVFKTGPYEWEAAFPNATAPALTLNTDSVTGGAVTVSSVAGKYGHLFRMDPAARYSVPYFTLVRGVGATDAGGGAINGLVQEVGVDCKIVQSVLNFAAGDALTTAFDVVGLRPQKDATAMTLTYDTGAILTVTDELADVNLSVDGTAYGAQTGTLIDVLAAQVTFSNVFDRPLTRLRIGSKEAIDLTLVDRACTIELGLEISDSDLYDRVCYNADNTWRDAPVYGDFSVVASNGAVDPHLLRMAGTNVLYSGMLIANEPERVVEARLTATLLKNDIEETFRFELLNDVSAYTYTP